MALCKHITILGRNLGKLNSSSAFINKQKIAGLAKYHGVVSSSRSAVSLYDYRGIVDLGTANGQQRIFPVDTLALVRSLEAQGLPTKHAEAITAVITQVLRDSLDNCAKSFVTKVDDEKSVMDQKARMSKFEVDLISKQEKEISSLTQDTEKLRNDIAIIRTEMKYEFDKVTAGQRLDLNLLKGGISDKLLEEKTGTTKVTSKLHGEIHGLKAQLDAAKLEAIKYCVGTVVSATVVGLGILRFFGGAH